MGKTPPPAEEKNAPPAQAAPAPKTQEAAVSEWKGPFCGVSDARAVLVTSEADWRKLWQDAFGEKEVPAVDFTEHVAAAVFLGLQRTGGHSVDFLDPESKGGKTSIRYRTKSPGPGSFVIQALTQPYAIKLFPKPAGDVEIKETRK